MAMKHIEKPLKQSKAKRKAQKEHPKSKAEKTVFKDKSAKSKSIDGVAQYTTFGEFASQVITEQFDRVLKREKSVLADKEPEHLHQMRVGTRRLRTALQVFESAVKIPDVASAKRLRDLAKVLGEVRDLDVQTASLAADYYPNLNKSEQKKLDAVSKSLSKKRIKAFDKMESVLTQEPYHKLKNAYQDWIAQPQMTRVAQLPIAAVLPDILSPLVSELLLHPAWLIATEELFSSQAGEQSYAKSEAMHDLRKVCKHVRYQTEFFTPFYSEEFGNWVNEVKQLQDDLGVFQDAHVLKDLLTAELGDRSKMPKLNELIRQEETAALANWEEIRQKYLDSGFRYHLHQLLLQPSDHLMKVHPELVEQQSVKSAQPNSAQPN